MTTYAEGMSDEILTRLEFARVIATQAGEVTLGFFERGVRAGREAGVESKADGTPVTRADRGAEELLRRLVKGRFPADGIIGEEFGIERGTTGFDWVFDPIDGTKSFVAGVPLFGTMVGVLDGRGEVEEPVAGVIHLPALEETIWAGRGVGAWSSVAGGAERRAWAGGAGSLRESMFVYTAPDVFLSTGRWGAFERLTRATRLSRGWSDCYGCVLVATGRADMWVEPLVSLWDVAAAVPILEEAGAVYTDWQGRRDWRSGSCVAASPGIHREAVALLAEAVPGLKA